MLRRLREQERGRAARARTGRAAPERAAARPRCLPAAHGPAVEAQPRAMAKHGSACNLDGVWEIRIKIYTYQAVFVNLFLRPQLRHVASSLLVVLVSTRSFTSYVLLKEMGERLQ